jgi:hypothetical protein
MLPDQNYIANLLAAVQVTWTPGKTSTLLKATQDEEEEENSDGEQNFDWGDESHQQDWGDETLDLDHHYGKF